MFNRPQRIHTWNSITLGPNAAERGGLGKVVGGQAAALNLAPGETITRAGGFRRSIFALIYPIGAFARHAWLYVRSQSLTCDFRLHKGHSHPSPFTGSGGFLAAGAAKSIVESSIWL